MKNKMNTEEHKGRRNAPCVPFKKDDEFEIKIEDIGTEGEGIGHKDGFTVFVKDTVMDDVVKVRMMKVKKNYGYGKLLSVIKPSMYRVEARCELASKCGGCQLQHLCYEKQLEYKQNKVINCFKRIGGFEKMEQVMDPIIGMENPFFYRNKAQFPVGKEKEGKIVTGFYAGRTHSIIDISHCYIQDRVNEHILPIIKNFMNEYKIEPYHEENHIGLVRHILTRVGFETREVMVCIVINGKKIPYQEKLIEALKGIKGIVSICLNYNTEKTNVILGESVETIWGQGFITDYIGNIQYHISPLSFYQVNPVQTKKLYETALEFASLSGKETVWDLYCGIGTISLFLAQKAKMVYGVEIVPQAIEDARVNAQINGITNAEFYVGAAEVILSEKYKEAKEGIWADVIVIDPPRKGCEEMLLDVISKMHPQKVVYISCDPATLARDAKYLCDRGYEIKRVRACDMFGQGIHVETVALLTRKAQ